MKSRSNLKTLRLDGDEHVTDADVGEPKMALPKTETAR